MGIHYQAKPQRGPANSYGNVNPRPRRRTGVYIRLLLGLVPVIALVLMSRVYMLSLPVVVDDESSGERENCDVDLLIVVVEIVVVNGPTVQATQNITDYTQMK